MGRVRLSPVALSSSRSRLWWGEISADAGAGGVSVPHRVPQQVMPATSKAPHRLPFPVKAFPDPIKKSHSHLQDSITVAIGARAPAIGARPVSAPVDLGSQHVARHAESCVSSGFQIPAHPFLKFTGRGAARTLPPRPLPKTVHESAGVSEVTCPHGCKLKLMVYDRDG